jgi:Flp pilus assembly protein TadD
MAKCNNNNCVNIGSHQCTGCKITLYCCRACQIKDWTSHKKDCIPKLDKDSLKEKIIKVGQVTYNKNQSQETLYTKANECIENKDGEGALEILKNCSKIYDKIDKIEVSKIRVTKALALILDGSPDKAYRELRKAIQSDEKNATAYNALGMLYNEVGKYNIAKKLIERAIDLRPNQPEFQVNYALVLKNAGNIDDAGKVLCNVIKNNVEFSKRLGIIS